VPLRPYYYHCNIIVVAVRISCKDIIICICTYFIIMYIYIYVLCMWSAFPGDRISENMQRGRLQNIILYCKPRVGAKLLQNDKRA